MDWSSGQGQEERRQRGHKMRKDDKRNGIKGGSGMEIKMTRERDIEALQCTSVHLPGC